MNGAKIGTAAERRSDMALALGMLDDEVSALTDAVTMLMDKTFSVRRPASAVCSEEAKKEPKEEEVAPLAEAIMWHSLRVREARTTLRYIESHIEL